MSGKGSDKCKVPKARMHLVCLREWKKTVLFKHCKWGVREFKEIEKGHIFRISYDTLGFHSTSKYDKKPFSELSTEVTWFSYILKKSFYVEQ